MSSRILVVTAQGEVRYLGSESEAVRVLTIQPTGARGEAGAPGAGVAAGGSANDILKKTSATNYATAWETPTSAATANTVVRRDETGGAFFGGDVGAPKYRGNFYQAESATDGASFRNSAGTAILTWGVSGQNLTVTAGTAVTYNATSYTFGTGAAAAFKTGLAIVSADISDASSGATNGSVTSKVAKFSSGGDLFARVFSAKSMTITGTGTPTLTIGNASDNNGTIKATNLTADRALELPDAAGTLALTTSNVATATALATSRNIFGLAFDGTANVSGDATNSGHFASIPTGGAAGHFITKNGTTPTLVAGRSAWFSDSSGSPQFKNGTGGAVTLIYDGGALGTPLTGTLTNCTGLPISTGIAGLGTSVATALAVNVGSAGAFVVNGGALGTPSSGTVTNLTGTASININGTVGATTATTGAFTTLTANGATTLTAGTASTSNTTGTLVVTGGVGASGAIYTTNRIWANSGGAPVVLGGLAVGDGVYGGLWINQASPSSSNYSFLGQAGQSLFNATSGGTIEMRISNSAVLNVGPNGVGIGIGNNTSPTILFEVKATTTRFSVSNAGSISIEKTITATGITTPPTINKASGSVNFAAAATSLVVTNSLCTTSSVINATMATNDATASGLRVVAGSGSFTIYMLVAPTSETRVNFRLTN